MVQAEIPAGKLMTERDASFSALTQRHLDATYRVATIIVGDPAEAEDATHDALVLAWRRWPTLRDPAKFEARFHRILVNVCRDRLRGRRGVLPLTQAEDRAEAPASVGADERIALRSALA